MNISLIKEKGSKYIVFILVGLLILIMCIPTDSDPVSSIQEDSRSSEEGLEGRLEKVLSSMEGVGEVKVMINTQGDAESLFGSADPEGKVYGIVVVAEGAGNPTINARISDAVKALFSIDVHKISIVKMRSQEERK